MINRLRVLNHVLVLAFRANRTQAVLAVVLVVLLACATALTGYSQRRLVDAAGMSAVAGVVTAALLGGAAHMILTAGERIQSSLRNELAAVVNVNLSQEILSAAAAIPTIEHVERPEYLDRLMLLRNQTGALAAACWTTAETVSALVSVGLSVWLLGTVHWALSGLALLAVPPLLLAAHSRTLVRRAVEETAELARTEHELHQLLLNPGPAKEIRIALAAGHLDEHADQLWAQVLRRQARALVRGSGWQFAGWALYATGFVGSLAYVAHLGAAGAATPGDLVLVVTLGTQLRGQVAATVAGMTGVSLAGQAVEHYRWLLNYARRAGWTPGTGKARPSPPVRLRDGIRMEAVSFTYPGTGDPVLRDISLRLPAGATVAVVGINGAGKSTLVKLLVGLYRPDPGRITVDGVPLDAFDPAGWRERVSGTFQDFVKAQLIAREAVGVGDLTRIGDDASVRDAVTRAGAGPVIASLPAGLDSQLGPIFDGAELSHGQWQRLALARGLVRTAPLLFVLDEPSAALDPQAEHDLFQRFTRAARAASDTDGSVTVIISHRFSTVTMADLIVVLADGRIAQQGTHAELMRAGGAYAQLYSMQADSYR